MNQKKRVSLNKTRYSTSASFNLLNLRNSAGELPGLGFIPQESNRHRFLLGTSESVVSSNEPSFAQPYNSVSTYSRPLGEVSGKLTPWYGGFDWALYNRNLPLL